MRRSSIAILVALICPSGAAAQEMSDDALLGVFERQRAAFRAANQSELGMTRGLELLTVENVEIVTEDAGPGPSPQALTETETIGASVAEAGQAADPLVSPSGDATPLRVAGEPMRIGRLDPELQVNVHITFAFDSAALTPEQKPKLAQICTVMHASDINLFRISGHTDAVGDESYNQRLSLLRAQEVQRYFVNECGIEARRLEAVGLGKRLLLNPDDPRADENRRVEFQALS